MLGKLLTRLRTLPEMHRDMVDSLIELVLSSAVDIEDTVARSLVQHSTTVSQRSVAKLDDMDGEEMQYFGVDRRGATGPRSSQV